MLTKSCATEFTERPGWRVYDRGAKSAQEPEHFAKGPPVSGVDRDHHNWAI